MGCGCNKTRPRTAAGAPAPTLHCVVLDGGKGKVAFQTHNPVTARAVAKNYPGSIIDPDPGAPAAAEISAPGTANAS